MKLHELINLMTDDFPVCIHYKDQLYKWNSIEELQRNTSYYDQIKDLNIHLVWYSRNLYQSIVIEFE